MRPLAAALLLAGTLFCNPASAAAAGPALDIAPGPLQQALQQLSERTGLQILYDPALVQGRNTRGLKGTMTPGDALAKLLAQTNITYSFTGQDAVALFRKPERATAASATNTAAQPTPPRTVTITADRTVEDDRYNSNGGLSSTGMDESALLAPVASESLTRAILRDRQVNRLEDALQYVSATEAAPNGLSALGFQLRGFPTYQYYLDGVRVSPDLHHDGFRDMANIERIDVVKGPASLLYGRTEPGGAINLITKQALTEPHQSWEQQAGSFGRKRTELDVGGPIFRDHDLFYRVNAAYEDQQSFRGIPNRRLFLAPVLTENWSESLTSTLYAEYLNSHDFHDSGLPVIGNRLPPVPVQRTLEAGGEVHTQDIRMGLKSSYMSNDDEWTFSHHFDARWTKSPRSPGVALADDGVDPASCKPTACPVQRALVYEPLSTGHTYFASLEARGNIELWPMRHTMLAGVDFFDSTQQTQLETRSDPSLATDLFNPTRGPVPYELLRNPDWYSRGRAEERWSGAYFQDQVQLSEQLYLLAGVRYDNVQEALRNTVLIASQSYFDNGGGDLHRVDALKGRGGLLWHPTASLSLYANFIQNFGVTAGLYYSGNGQAVLYLPQEVANEWETGIKLETVDGRASATLAWFDLTKRNVSSAILEPAMDKSSVNFLMLAAINRGLEADFHGEILPGLQLLASYAYIESRIENGLAEWAGEPPKGAELLGATGDRLAGVPRHGGSLWTTYSVQWGALRGLKLGVGVVARGTRAGDNLNDYRLPGFAKCDALAAYSWHAAGARFSAQLNVNNVLDKRYFESLSGTRTVVPGVSRSWIATLGVEF